MATGIGLVCGTALFLVGEGLHNLSSGGESTANEMGKAAKKAPSEGAAGVALGGAVIMGAFSLVGKVSAAVTSSTGAGLVVNSVMVLSGYSTYSTITSLVVGTLAGIRCLI